MTPQQRVILQMVERGMSFEVIEDKINTVNGLDDDQRAALWLYAWSHRSRRAQRREAARLLFTE